MAQAGSVATLAVILLLTHTATAVVRLEVSSILVDAPGDTADLCVHLEADGVPVAGTGNRVVWDGTCATGPATANGCRVVEGHGKDLAWGPSPDADFSLSALVWSLTDVDPIPDGALYCCRFIVEAAPGTCCPVVLTRVDASDPDGNALAAAGGAAELCTATTAATAADHDGCQVSPPRRSVGPLAGALTLLAVRALRRRAPAGVRRRRSMYARWRRRCGR